MKIGLGYDIHRLKEGRKLILGGVAIPFALGLEGHSDADVLLHAICDGLLGAAGEADIGCYFPDTDAAFKDIASAELLKRVKEIIVRKGYAILNIDSVIIAQAPKINPFRNKIREKIAEILNINLDQINVKAKTAEELGPLGQSKAIACHVIVLIEKYSKKAKMRDNYNFP